ncbi:flagellar hook-length control protein FliK [bacterium]|nr:flagellar hook-length control protein FliK [bacterium]
MGSPDILTRVNNFLALLPPIHLYEKPEEKDKAESKDEFSLLLEKFLHEKDQAPDRTRTLETGKQIWQMMEKKNPALGLGEERAAAAPRSESRASLKTEGIKEGEGEDEKREYFSSLILSCFVEPGQRSNHPFEGYQDGGERLFFYSSQYSNQARGEGTSSPRSESRTSLKILKEAIGSLNKKKPEQGILEGFENPELVETGFGEDDLSLSGVSFKGAEGQTCGQGRPADQSETGEDGHKEEPFFPFFDSKDSDSSEERAEQDINYFLEDRSDSLFEEEESSSNDDFKENGDESFLAGEGNQESDVQSWTNLRSGQATSTPKFISEETKGEISKIIERIKLLKENDRTEVRMELDLERLGKLKVRIGKENGQLQTEFLAESQEAKELIESNIETLRDALASLGFGQVNIKTTVDHQGNNDFFRQKRGRSSPGRRLFGNKEEIEDDRPLISLRGESLNLVA